LRVARVEIVAFLIFLLSLNFYSFSCLAGEMSYLHLSGAFPAAGQDKVIAALKRQLTDPIDQHLKNIQRVYSYEVDGAAVLNFNLIMEARDDGGAKFITQFTSHLEKSGFLGASVSFQRATRIKESVNLIAGLHIPTSTDGSFNSTSSLNKSFELSSLNDWEKFTDHLGFAFMSKKSPDFLNYVSWFIGDPTAYQNYVEQVLHVSDVVLADLGPAIELESGAVIAADGGASPFFDVPFARSCWDPAYENGMCH
jgi:hypothetical protein